MKNNIKIIRLVAVVIVVVILTYIFVAIVHGISENDKALAEDLPNVYSITSEDSNLISFKYRSLLKVDEVVCSKVRNPIPFVYIDTAYHLILYKIDLKKDVSLKDSVITEFKSVSQSSGYSYGSFEKGIPFNFHYKAGEPPVATAIYLTIKSDSVRMFAKSDSMVGYNLKCKNLSIRFGPKEPIDIFISEGENITNVKNIPMSILLLKRKRAVYLFVLNPNRLKKTPLPPNLLYNIVTGN